MAKWQNDGMLDAALGFLSDYIAAGTAQQCLCPSQPATGGDAQTSALASGTLAVDAFTIADNDTGDGRKLTISEQANITVDTTGDVNHIALVDSGTSTLLYVTTCVQQSLTAGNQVTVPAWVIDMRDAQ